MMSFPTSDAALAAALKGLSPHWVPMKANPVLAFVTGTLGLLTLGEYKTHG